MAYFIIIHIWLAGSWSSILSQRKKKEKEKMHEESEASWACDIQVFAFLNDLGFNYSLCSHVALSGSSCLHPVNELSGSTTQWKSCIWCIGWRAWSTCVKSLWLWSPPERMAAQSTALERSHRSSLVFFFFFFPFLLFYFFFLSFFFKKRLSMLQSLFV